MFLNIMQKSIYRRSKINFTCFATNLNYHFASKKSPPISKSAPMKLVFDKENKTTIYKHLNGEVLDKSIY